MAPPPPLTPARRAIAAALLFLLAAALAGVALPAQGAVAYRVFGLPEAVFALLLTYVLVGRRVWRAAAGWAGWVALAYGTLANAQLLELLLPPPGLLEWAVLTGLALTAWGALGRGSRRRLLGTLASLALFLALLKFSVLPHLWQRLGPPPGAAFGLGDLAEGARRWLAATPPDRPATQLLGAAALGAWALATRLLWPPPARRGVDRRPREL